jgi:hypothetical protein
MRETHKSIPCNACRICKECNFSITLQQNKIIMSKIDYYQIALDKAKELGYDTIRFAGVRKGWRYFHLIKYSLIGKKVGLPKYVRIDCNGIVLRLEERDDIIWALHQEISLNNL